MKEENQQPHIITGGTETCLIEDTIKGLRVELSSATTSSKGLSTLAINLFNWLQEQKKPNGNKQNSMVT